jgi:predicted dithiol-disulfide oxidoreductase (DUF899 family)
MGWDVPWYSSLGTTFNADMGATIDGAENHMLSVFVRDGDRTWRSYFTQDRGVEHLGSHWTYLDLTPYGRPGDVGRLATGLAPRPRLHLAPTPR